MNEDAVCELCEPHYPELVEEIREAFGDFDHIVADDARPTVLAARAKITNCRLTYRMAARFGRDRTAPIRMQTLNGMDVLVIQGNLFDVGLRLKKFDGHYRSFNHVSDQQTALRTIGEFPRTLFRELEVPTIHLFLGYRCTAGVEPCLRDVALSFEGASVAGRYYVDWHRVIWTPDDGFEPPQTYTPPLFPTGDISPNFDIRPRRPGGPERRESGDGTAG